MAHNPIPNTVTLEYHEHKGWGAFHNEPVYTPAIRGFWETYAQLLNHLWDRLPGLDYPACDFPNRKTCPAVVKCRRRCGFTTGCIDEWGDRLKKEPKP